MTTAAGPATDLLDPPEPERSSPRAAEEALRIGLSDEEPAEPAEAQPGEPAPAPGAAAGAPRGRRRRGRPRKHARQDAAAAAARPGGHKPTKAELEELTARQAARIQQLETAAAPDAAAQVQQLADNLQKLVNPLVRLMVSWRGPHWQLTAQEQREIAEGWAPYLLPKVAQLAEQTPLVMALTVTALALAKPLTVEFGLLTGPQPAPGGELVTEPVTVGL